MVRKIAFEFAEANNLKHNLHKIFGMVTGDYSNASKTKIQLLHESEIVMPTFGERGITNTVVCIFSAFKKYIPSFFNYKKEKIMNARLLRGRNVVVIAAVTNLEWINENLVKSLPTVEKLLLLVLDSHENQVNFACYLLCLQN